MSKHWGATPEAWRHFKRLAKVDLLPVVSNPHAPKSPHSKMKHIGKTPSTFNHKGEVIGFTEWTEHEATVRNIEEWEKQPDFGICIQTRRIRAFDCDVPDCKLSQRIVAAFLKALGRDALPTRSREGTGKQLLAFIVEGDLEKRSFVVKEWPDEETGKTKRWIVEFLAEGQQFVAVGTHTEGMPYAWQGGWPDEFPTISAKAFDRAWQVVVDEFALEGVDRRAERRDPTLPEDLDNIEDPVAEHLVEHWDTYGVHKGMLLLECPWADNHSSDNGETQTAWMLAGTGKYRNGHFSCRHAGCADKTDDDFLTAVGFKLVKPESFDDLSTFDDAVVTYAALAAGTSPKSKELKAERAAALNLPLPGFYRDARGRIETSLENLTTGLLAPQAIGCEVAFDEFLGEMVYADQAGEWQPLTDGFQTELTIRLERLGFKDQIGTEKLRRALNWVSERRRIDTAIAWLKEVVPQWDGISRVARFFPRYMATADTPYTRACGDYLWTALAGRVLQPGLKADMVPVLVGAQGSRKSSGISAISPAKRFFSEFDLDARDDDKARRMRGCLVGELAELRGLQSRDRESILAWIARDTEEWTPKYKEHKVQLARRCVFLGSTNDEEFLSDPTGERRWLPLLVTGLVDVPAIQNDRLQLWAEARDLFEFEGLLHERAEQLARGEHHKFKVGDEWLPQVARWLDSPWSNLEDERLTPRTCGRLLAADVLVECLGVRPGKREQMRVTGILKALGMVRAEKRVPTSARSGKGRELPKSWVWVNGTET